MTSKKRIWEFRDQNTPGRLLYLLRDQEITLTDFLLLSTIHSMVKPQGDRIPGRGCFASNEYLAKVVRNNPNYVSSRLWFLQRKKLLMIVKMSEKRRFLETEWARTGEEREELEGDYGRAYRKAYFKMFGVKIQKSSVRKTLPKSEMFQENLKQVGDVSGKPERDVSGKPNHIDKDTDYLKGKGAAKRRSPPSENGFHGEPPKFLKWAKQARGILKSKEPPIWVNQVSRETVAREARKLWRGFFGKSDARMAQYLDSYATQVNNNSFPQVSNPKQLFTQDMCEWLLRLMKANGSLREVEKKEYVVVEVAKGERQTTYYEEGQRAEWQAHVKKARKQGTLVEDGR